MTDTPSLRLTQAMQLVLRTLLLEPTKETYGGEIGRNTGLPSGTITPILGRLEKLGILQSRIEDVDPRAEGRPRRKYYSFTADGAAAARYELARTYKGQPAGTAAQPGLAGGTA